MYELLYVGIPLMYLFLGGMAYGLASPGWHGADRNLAAVFWPVTLVSWFVYQIATAGPRLIKWYRAPKLPKARVVL
jgi:hypothetical protein